MYIHCYPYTQGSLVIAVYCIATNKLLPVYVGKFGLTSVCIVAGLPVTRIRREVWIIFYWSIFCVYCYPYTQGSLAIKVFSTANRKLLPVYVGKFGFAGVTQQTIFTVTRIRREVWELWLYQQLSKHCYPYTQGSLDIMQCA